MKISLNYFTILCSIILASTGYIDQAGADSLFFDDFEDRVKDQAIVGPGWTWYNQTFEGDTCVDDPEYGFGPYDDGDPSDYEQDNRNYWTASNDVGQGDSYYRAGLEVPAWADDEGAPVVLDNMMRVYGDQYYDPGVTSCKRTLIFQEMAVVSAGTFTFSFDVAQDRYGAPAFGEFTGAFVKVLRSSDGSYTTVLFEKVETIPPVATSPGDVTMNSQEIEFTMPDEMVGELLQFGFYNDLSENLGQAWGTSAALYDNVMLAPLDIGPAHSGSFYNEDQSGHGFSIEFGELDGSPLAIVYWYTYDDLGNPIFMVGSGEPDGQEVMITFDSPVGMKYGEFDPNTVTREVGGVAVFNFSDRDNAVFSYTPSEFSVTEWGHSTPIEALPLTKVFGIPADKYFSTSE